LGTRNLGVLFAQKFAFLGLLLFFRSSNDLLRGKRISLSGLDVNDRNRENRHGWDHFAQDRGEEPTDTICLFARLANRALVADQEVDAVLLI
ncbi:MAG: hypothetical protein ABJA67_16230, partial [Chthonomonadales bacterium]